jgi:hypothetical protein
VDVIHAAGAGFFQQLLHGEAADAAALVVGVDVDAPEHGAEVLVQGVGIEVRAHEAHDLVAVEHHALPGGAGVCHRARDRIAGGGEILLLPRLERHRVDGDDRRGGQFLEAQLGHALRLPRGKRGGTLRMVRKPPALRVRKRMPRSGARIILTSR